MDKIRFRKYRKLNQLITGFVALMLVYQPCVYADQLALPSTDLVAPEGQHDPVQASSVAGQSLTIDANVVDNIGVSKVTLFYRTVGTETFSAILMSSSGGDSFSITLKGEFVAAPGIEYYIQAEDKAGNTRTFGYQFSPYIVKVTPGGLGQELDLDFDATEGDYEENNASIAVIGSGSPSAEGQESIFSNKWLWIGLGVLAAAAAGGGGGDSGGGGDGGDNSGTIVITGPSP